MITAIWILAVSSAIFYQSINEKVTFVSCTTLSQNIFGKCVRVQPLSNYSASNKKLLDLGLLHAYAYVVLRRVIEAAAYCSSRCILFCSPVIFSLSLGRLILRASAKLYTPVCQSKKKEFLKKKDVPEANIKTPKRVRRRADVITIAFLLSSSAVILSIIAPFVYELNYGSALAYQLSSFESAEIGRQWLPWPFTSSNYFRKAFYGGQHCLSIFGLYDFWCLRETIFHLRDSGLKQVLSNEPQTVHEKLCLQLHIANINCSTAFVLGLLYLSTFFSIILVLKGLLVLKKQIMNRVSKRITKEICSTSRKKGVGPYEDSNIKEITEHYEKKIIKPGSLAPWREMNFTSEVNTISKTHIKKRVVPQKPHSVSPNKMVPIRTPIKDLKYVPVITNQGSPSNVSAYKRKIRDDSPFPVISSQYCDRRSSLMVHDHKATDTKVSEDRRDIPTYPVHDPIVSEDNKSIGRRRGRMPFKYYKSQPSTSSIDDCSDTEVLDRNYIRNRKRSPDYHRSGLTNYNFKDFSSKTNLHRDPQRRRISSTLEGPTTMSDKVPLTPQFRSSRTRSRTASPIDEFPPSPVAYFDPERPKGSQRFDQVQSRVAKTNGVDTLRYLGRSIKEYY